MNEIGTRIKTVSDNQEKSNAFKENMKRFNKAKASEFYFECLWILYAMLEDRTSAFHYYLGFTSSENRNLVIENKRFRREIRQIFSISENNAKYKFDSFTGKLLRIEELIIWSQKSNDNVSSYQVAVKETILKLVLNEELIEILCYLNCEWRNKRNQLVHALFNKNTENVNQELKVMVEKGYRAVRILDNTVSKLKKEKIRDHFKIK